MSRYCRWTLLVALLTALIVSGQTPAPANVCRIVVQNSALVVGKQDTLRVAIYLEGGWHINAHQPGSEFAIPTVIKLNPLQGLVTGEILYPQARSVDLPYSEDPVNVYQDSAFIKIPVRLVNAAKSVIISGKLRYQACNDEICLPPSSITFQDTLTIESD